MKTVQQIINSYRSELSSQYDKSEIEQIIALIFNDVMRLSKIDLVLKNDQEVNTQEEKILMKHLFRLKQNEPLQYVLGNTWFNGLMYYVDNNVLIPRPETEELVHWILENITTSRQLTAGMKILDIGTGSGCIAISLKENMPDCLMYAIDNSSKALDVAKKNAALNNVEVIFIEGDILKPDATFGQPGLHFDIIVSNPPYIKKSEMNTLNERVTKNEPSSALFVDDKDPLLFYRIIADFSKKYLKKGGKLYFEINESFGKQITSLLKEKKLKEVLLKMDLSGKDRMVAATN